MGVVMVLISDGTVVVAMMAAMSFAGILLFQGFRAN